MKPHTKPMVQTISSSQRHSFSLRCCLAITLFLTMIAFAQPVQAQPKYGISAVTTVTPPHPITLDGFVAEGGTKIALQILPTDVTIAQYPVLLKLVISGNGITLESKTLNIHEPVYLNGNEVTRLDGNDLQAFFNPDNLIFNGYSKTQYQRNGRLPEGVYTVGFELYDVLRKIQVASVKSTLVFLFLNEVPSLNLPLNNDLISAAGTQVINFRWSTRHSPLAATFFTPQYLFELWDIQPDGINPYEVVRGTRPVYASTVSSTYVSYGVTEPPLLPGHTYAWRVRETDPDGKTLFKNEGYSEVYTFKYGIKCPAPELKADKAGTSNLSVLWQASPDQNKFELRYRDKKKKNPEWYTQSVNTLSSKVENLKSNTVYEIEVCAICGDQRSEYSNRVEMNTCQNTSFKCGQIDSSKLPQNQNPLRKLSSGDVFKAFGFDVEVKEASGSGGTFTGKGYVLVPMLNFIKIEAKFDNARINEDYQLIGGEVKTVYNLKNSLTYIPGQGVAGLSDLTDLAKLIAGDKEKNNFDDLADKKIEVDSVKDIKIEGNKIIVTDANGKTEEITTGKVVAITTDEGKEYVVDSNGTIYSSGNSGQKANSGTPSGPVTTAAQSGKGSPKYSVSFIPHKLQEYGFDVPTDKSPKDNYEQVSLTENPILVPWKSLEAGHIERTIAEITGGPADSVRYYRQSNNVVMTAPGEKTTQQQIMLNGNGKNDEDKLFAWYATPNQADTGKKTYARVLAGQLNLISYEKKSIKVVLVPVNNASCPDAGYVKTELNKIYKSAVVDWDVVQGNNIKVTFTGSVFDNTDPNERMDYTDDMKAAINVLKEDAQYNRETYYLFFLDNAKDLTIKGFMPLKQQFGFIFKYKQYPDEYLRTIAHELGHGPFRLWHTFSNSNKYIQPQGSTDNLMDYANASALKLNKYQWDWMHDPEWRLYWFTEEDEGAEVKSSGIFFPILDQKSYSTADLANIKEFVKSDKECIQLDLTKDWILFTGNTASILCRLPKNSNTEFEPTCCKILSKTNVSEQFLKVKNNPDQIKKLTEFYGCPEDWADKYNCLMLGVELTGTNAKIKSTKVKGEVFITSNKNFKHIKIDEIKNDGFAPTFSNATLDINWYVLFAQSNQIDIKITEEKNNTLIYKTTIDIKTLKSGVFKWDGIMNQGINSGKTITLDMCPFTVTLKLDEELIENPGLSVDKERIEWEECCKVDNVKIKTLVAGGFEGYKKYKKMYQKDGITDNTLEYFGKNLNEHNFLGLKVIVHDKFWKLVLEPINNELQNIKSLDGCSYAMRAINGDPNNLSPHAYGCAIDIQPMSNPQMIYNTDRPIFYLIKKSTGVNMDGNVTGLSNEQQLQTSETFVNVFKTTTPEILFEKYIDIDKYMNIENNYKIDNLYTLYETEMSQLLSEYEVFIKDITINKSTADLLNERQKILALAKNMKDKLSSFSQILEKFNNVVVFDQKNIADINSIKSNTIPEMNNAIIKVESEISKTGDNNIMNINLSSLPQIIAKSGLVNQIITDAINTEFKNFVLGLSVAIEYYYSHGDEKGENENSNKTVFLTNLQIKEADFDKYIISAYGFALKERILKGQFTGLMKNSTTILQRGFCNIPLEILDARDKIAKLAKEANFDTEIMEWGGEFTSKKDWMHIGINAKQRVNFITNKLKDWSVKP